VKKDVENWGCYKNAFLYGYLHEDVYMAQPPNLFILISQTMFANFKSLSMVFVKHQEHGFHAWLINSKPLALSEVKSITPSLFIIKGPLFFIFWFISMT
jgi:hypothetical protein